MSDFAKPVELSERHKDAVKAIYSGTGVIGKGIAVTTAHELVKLGLLVRGKGDHHSGWWSQAELTDAGITLALA